MNPITIGKFLKELRKEKSLSREQLAAAMQVPVKTVCRWESGKEIPDCLLIPSLCEALGISVAEFVAGKPLEDRSAAHYTQHQLMDLIRQTQDLQHQKTCYKVLAIALGIYFIYSVGYGCGKFLNLFFAI